MIRARSVLMTAWSLVAVFAAASPCEAQLLRSKAVRRPPRAMAPAPTNHGFANYIRRLKQDAEAAAARGDYAAAKTFAERAYKVSLTARTQLAQEPDCSPETLSKLVSHYRSEQVTHPGQSGVAASRSSEIDLSPLLDQSPNDFVEVNPRAPQHAVEFSKTLSSKPRVASNKLPNEAASVHRETTAESRTATSSRGRSATADKATATSPDRTAAAAGSRVKSSLERPTMLEDRAVKQHVSSRKPGVARAKPAASAPSPAVSDHAADQAREDAFFAEDEPPEVTTAVGHSDNRRLQLDIEDQESGDAEEAEEIVSAPRLETSRQRPQGSMAKTSRASSSVEETRLGVWSPGSASTAARSNSVVSLTDFLDPSTRPAGSLPRMVETDFRNSTVEETTAARSPASGQPKITASKSVFEKQPRPAPRSKADLPAVVVQEEVADRWGTADDEETAAVAGHTSPRRAGWTWPNWPQWNLPMLAGGMLLAFGCLLFGLSFRPR